MSKVCQLTGKKPTRGYKYTIRGIAKKKKGIGLKVTGKTKRRFQPNLIEKRFGSQKKTALFVFAFAHLQSELSIKMD